MMDKAGFGQALVLCAAILAPGVAVGSEKTTQDLSFLLGSWSVTRTYAPGKENERSIHGLLECTETLEAAYIFCRYEFRPVGGRVVIDDVYFNYNGIYGQYESIWLSATWPIKVTMSGQLVDEEGVLKLRSAAEFPIENGVIEYVRGELAVDTRDDFTRNTHIRTSERAAGDWTHHMVETATRK